MNLLQGRVVLVSGGTQGVGAGIVRAAAGEGATVAFTGRRPDAGDKLTAELASAGAASAFIQTDLAEPQQAINSVRQTVDRFGRIDCLVNSAGLTTAARCWTPRSSFSISTWRSTCGRRSSRCRLPSRIWCAAESRARSSTSSPWPSMGGQPYLSPYAAAKAGSLV